MSHTPAITKTPHPSLDELLCQMGEVGARICEIEAAEAGAGNISVFLSGRMDLSSHFTHTEPIDLPAAYPALAGGTILATGSGRRLRQISNDPLSAVGAIRIHADGRLATLHTAGARKFTRLTSELNSHLGVHQDQVARRGIGFHAVVHAQPPHLTHLSHVPAYRDTAQMNRALLRWEPETIVALSQGIGVLPFFVPGSEQMERANVEGLRAHSIVVWSKHGTMSRSDESVLRALDHVEYAETAARYEYMNLVAGGHAQGLTKTEIRAVASAFNIDSPWL